MAQTVQIPGVGTLQFPDGMSQDDMAKAIQANYPQLTGPSTQHPDDSGFLSRIKDLGTEAGRVGIKAVTGLPLMAMDAGVGARNMIGRATGTQSDFDLPSDSVNAAVDHYLPRPASFSSASEGLNTLLASLGMPGPSGVKAAGDLALPKQSLTGADAVKAEAMGAARNNGVVIPPTLTKDAPLGARAANGWGGQAETLKGARDLNTPAINGMVAKDLGLDAGSQLNTGPNGTITGQINDAVKAGYDPVRDIGAIPVDDAHRALVKSIAGMDRGASNISPALGNSKIAELSDALMPPATKVDGVTNAQEVPKFDSGDMVDAISALRAKATDAFASGERALGAAYKKAANGFESLIDRHLQDSDAPDAADKLNAFRLARTRIAKGNDAKDALNPATGDIDPRILAANDEGQLTGGLKQAATIARAFPDAVIPAKGTPSPVTAFQANMAPEAVAASPVMGTASVLAGLLGRGAARKYALGSAQNSLMQPKGATLSGKALDAVFSNPSAFASMYEDQR